LITIILIKHNMKYTFHPFKTKLRRHLDLVYPQVGSVIESEKNPSVESLSLYWNLEYKMSGRQDYNSEDFTPFTEEKRRLLSERRRLGVNRPSFHRYLSIQYRRLDSSWRRPRGHQNKLRRGLKDKGTKVDVGFAGPVLVRGLNRKGYQTIRIESQADLNNCLLLDPKSNFAVISGIVGLRRTIEIENTLFRAGWHVDNWKKLYDSE
jgi:large subunit ribosomal protein L32e